MQYHELITTITQKLHGYDDDEQVCQHAAEQLAARITGHSREQLICATSIMLRPEQVHWLERSCDDLVNHHKPLAFVLGTVQFGEIELLVEPPVLIPRPETEYWVYELLEKLKKSTIRQLQILDLCSGTGCIALALAHGLPHAQIDALDSNPDAVALAQKNAERLHLEKRVHIFQSNLFNAVDGQYDLIVANPPYIPSNDEVAPSVQQWEDPVALFSGTDGLELIKMIMQGASAYLKESDGSLPSLVLEIDMTQGKAVVELAQEYHYKKVLVHKDQFDRDRWVELWR